MVASLESLGPTLSYAGTVLPQQPTRLVENSKQASIRPCLNALYSATAMHLINDLHASSLTYCLIAPESTHCLRKLNLDPDPAATFGGLRFSSALTSH